MWLPEIKEGSQTLFATRLMHPDRDRATQREHHDEPHELQNGGHILDEPQKQLSAAVQNANINYSTFQYFEAVQAQTFHI